MTKGSLAAGVVAFPQEHGVAVDASSIPGRVNWAPQPAWANWGKAIMCAPCFLAFFFKHHIDPNTPPAAWCPHKRDSR